MTTRLDKLSINRVALVDRGADQDAHIVLFKRLDKEGDGNEGKTHAGNGVSKGDKNMGNLNLEALPESMRQHFEGSELSQSVIDGMAETFKSATDSVPEAATTELETAKSELVEAQKALKAKEDEDGKGDEKDVTKGMTDEVKAEFAKMQTDRDELRKAHEAEVEKRETRDQVEIAKSNYSNIPGADPEVLGPMLYRIDKNLATADDLTKFAELLKAADATTLANTLLKQELGTSGGPAPTDAEDRIEKIAKGLQTEDPKLSEAQAWDAALMTPEGGRAYAEMRRERMAGAVTD